MPTRRSLLHQLAFLVPAAAFAQAPDLRSPVGLWETIDDRSGKPRAVVRIFEHQGHFYGDVARVLEADKVNAVCQKCTDDRKDKPVLGLQIMRGLAADGDGWTGGTILDPETGDTYRCSMRLSDNGRKLIVRGYLGISLLGRSQTWLRMG